MTKKCDNKSVGMLVWRRDSLLLIERKKQPFGFASPAGHVDGDTSFEEAARRELEEEVGLKTEDLTLLFAGKKENLCRRDGGSWHYWKVFEVKASGEVKRSKDETKQAVFCEKKELSLLVDKTKQYLQGSISETDWEKSPGLEPVWYELLEELKIL